MLRRLKSYQVSVLTTMEQTRNQQQKKNWKFHKHVEINTILSDKWVTEEIKGKIRNILRPKKKKMLTATCLNSEKLQNLNTCRQENVFFKCDIFRKQNTVKTN